MDRIPRHLQEIAVIDHRKILEEEFSGIFRPLGYRKRRSSWYRIRNEMYSIVNIQAAEWDRSFYVNIGFMPKEQMDGTWLPHNKCHVGFRAERLKVISSEAVPLLDEQMYARMDENWWRTTVRSSFVEPLAQAVALVDDIRTLKRLLAEEVSNQIFLHKDIRPLLQEPWTEEP